jgi:thiopurine S-methyltransferase
MSNENANFWRGRWKRGEIGWHQSEIEPGLVKWASQRKPSRILVPLCGKSLDLIWLASKGYEVIGVELSELACEALFSENQIEYRKSSAQGFNVFTAPGLTIFNGDFFKLSPELLGPIGAVYDRAALIALPEDVRTKYSAHLMKLIGPSFENDFGFLQIIIERTPYDLTGPPFSVSPKEVEAFYGKKFKIEILSKELVTARAPEGSKTHELILSLLVH